MSVSHGVSWKRIRTFAAVVAWAAHLPQIKSGVLCPGIAGDSSPRGAVVSAVINVDGVTAGVLSAPVNVLESARSSKLLRRWA